MTTPADRLEEIKEKGLLRRMRTVESAQGPRIRIDGEDVLLLCCNDYLGLTTHPAVTAAAIDAVERWGTGAGASRLISGNMRPHERLEGRLAAFHGDRGGAAFRLGFLANTGIVAALAQPGRSSSATSSTTRASSMAAASPAPRPSSTAIVISSTSPGAWGRIAAARR